MTPRIEIAAELIAQGKALYEHTDMPVLEICDRMGISRNVLYTRIDRWKWQRRRYSAASAAEENSSDKPIATDRAPQPEAGASVPLESPADFYARVCRGVQRQMAIVERVQARLLPADGVPSERSVRILATVNKVLLEIEATAKPHKVPDEPDDSIPCDIEEFRAELAQRIRGLVDAERRSSGESAGPDSAE